MLSQFVAAFDDCFVFRFTKDFEAKEKIAVRYIMGPKQRVLHDIVNPAKNMTLPVISMDQKNLRRDSTRIQFKDQKMIRHHMGNNNISKIPSPIPVSMDVEVSIVANYKEDIDQIVSNFVPWCNPYFVISWKIPEAFGLDFIDELRTEVTWSGSIDYETPLNIDNSEKYKIVGNTSFVIKGWLFPPFEVPVAPIYVVHTNFIAVSSETNLDSNNYSTLSGIGETEFVSISAYPEFTNCFINGRPFDNLSLYNVDGQTFTFYGKRFDFGNTWYLSGNQTISGLIYEEINTAKFPTISAYRIPDVFVTTVNDNIVSISLSSGYVTLSGGDYIFITANEAGWSSSCGVYVDVHDLWYNGITITYNGETIIYN